MKVISSQYKYLWVLIVGYVFMLVSSDLYESKLIHLLWLHAGAGILLFSLTFLIVETITEVYGYKRGRLAIWLGVIFCIVFILCAQIILLLPISANQSDTDALLAIVSRTRNIFCSTLLTVFIAEHVNAYIIAKLKIIFKGKLIGIRFILSTLMATGVSMFIFTLFAFYGRMPFVDYLALTFTSWMYRFLTEILFVPFTIRFANVLKRIEQTDIYDTTTNYNVFNFDNSYSENSNHYQH